MNKPNKYTRASQRIFLLLAFVFFVFQNSFSKNAEVTRTWYDASPFSIPNIALSAAEGSSLNRVAATTYEDVYSGNGLSYQSASHYFYDIAGNVKTLIQENTVFAGMAGLENQRYKRVDYNYDLISGKVNAVYYQAGSRDRFYHRYQYDADNRLTAAQTSADGGITWLTDASYMYYRHGPLAREVIGERQVQGVDYAYTLQGWLKVINSTVRDAQYDMGGDGVSPGSGGPVNPVARDVYGFSIGYYDNTAAGGHKDYDPIGSSVSNEAAYGGSAFGNASPSLFNGNIRHTALSLAGLPSGAASTIGYAYQYDQLNRLLGMETHTAIASNAWSTTGASTNDYDIALSYDENGNIMTNRRNAHNGTGVLQMDDMAYAYEAQRNRLHKVSDQASLTSNFAGDIDGENTYTYDATGNLVREEQSDGTALDYAWNNYGKLKSVTRSVNMVLEQSVVFAYDPMGNRISKAVTNGLGTTTTYYVRDAQGNLLANYTLDNSGALALTERDLYGSKRLGVDRPGLLMTGAGPAGSCDFTSGGMQLGR